MPRFHPCRAMLVMVLAVFPNGCGWYPVITGPSLPEYRTPNDADIEHMTQRMMGQAPAKPRAVSRDGVEVVFQTGHAGAIHALAASPNGRYLASSGAQDGTVKVWDVASGQEIRNFTGFGGIGQSVDLLAFSEDSARIVTHEYGGAVKVFEVATGREVRAVGSLLGGGGAISANGRFSAAIETKGTKSNTIPPFSGDQSIAILDLSTGRPVWTLPESHMQRPVAMSRDGTVVVTVRTDAGIQASAGPLETVGATIGSIIGLGDLFTRTQPAETMFTQELVVWDVAAKRRRRSWPHTAMSEGMDGTLSPDGRYFVTEQPIDRALRILDLETGKATSAMWLKASGMKGLGMTHSLVFSPDGKFLALARGDGLAKVFEFPGGREVKEFEATSLNFSPDGAALIVGSMTGGAPYLQDVATGQETRLAGGVSGVADLALTPDGRSVVAGMEGGSAKLWDLATGQIVRTFECPDGMAVSSVSVSRAGPLVATGCVNGSAWLWELSSGRQVRKLLPALPPDQFGQVLLRFTNDGRTIVMGLKDQIVVADVTSGKERHRITLPHDAPSRAMAMMENPGAAYEGLDPKLRAMMETQAQSQPSQIDARSLDLMKEAEHWIRSLAVHPKDELVAIAKSGGTSLWDLRSGKRVFQFRDMSLVEANAAQRRVQEQEYQRVLEEAGSLKSLLPFGLGAPSPSVSGGPTMMLMNNPADLFEAMSGDMDVANSLAFSPDGRFLLTEGVRGKTIWDTATGKKIRTSRRASHAQPFDPMSVLDDMEINIGGMGVAFSPDGRLAARGHGQLITVWDVASGRDRFELAGHTAAVKSLAFSPDGRMLFSGGADGALRVWDLRTGNEQAALIALGREDFVTVTPDQYYRASKTRLKGVAFRVKEALYPFEQFDLRFNRPDIVLTRLGMAPSEVVQSYRLAYHRRLKKMGLSEQRLGTDFHLPEIQLLTQDVPVSIAAGSVTLRVKATDDRYFLDRLNVFLNDVPVYGTSGLPVPGSLHAHVQELQVPLVPGRNKIQVSVQNQQGVESLKQTLYTTSTAAAAPPEVFIVGIGVSEYKDKTYNLRYAAKDAADLIATYQAVDRRAGTQTKIHTLNLSNQKATKGEILKAKEWLRQSKTNDLVVVFAAGHGMTDDKSDYYFGTYDIDPKHPAAAGLPYEEFENLLDGIPALQKVLLLDTCFSGEIEKDQPVVVAQADTGGSGMVKMRAFKAARGVSVVAGDKAAAGVSGPRLSSDMLRFQQDWFADLRRGTGAAVISSSSGNEYSLEGEQWRNGVFTYALLTGLRQHAADANKDRVVTVSELQAYVIEQVRKLTEGGQNPTVRRENLEHDFVVY